MSSFLQVFLSLFSALLLALAIPNELFLTGCPFIALFSLVPLYVVISNCKNYKEAFWLFWLHGGFTHLLSSFWLKNFQGMAFFTLGASLAGTAFIEAFIALILFYPFSKKDKDSSPVFVLVRIFYFAFIWVIYEWCKSTGFLAYPWGTLSMTAVRWPVIMQIADITGQYGVSFLFALFSAVLAQGILIFFSGQNCLNIQKIRHSYRLSVNTVAALFAISLFYGIYQYSKPRIPVKQINTVLVQQDLDTLRSNEMAGIRISQDLTDDGLQHLKEQKLSADLVVWSEGILNRRWPNSENFYSVMPDEKPLLKFIAEKKVPFVIGGALILDSERHKYSNAALLFDKNGKYAGAYSKLHLVPFAEAIPFVDYEPVRKFIKKIAGFSYGWTAGSKNTVFELPLSTPQNNTSGSEIISLVKNKNSQNQTTALVAFPICFDDAFGHVFRGLSKAGAELFINITNDSWSKTKSAEYQHYAVAAYRAIEFRTTLARCTNSGYTVVLDPTGKITAELPLFEQGQLSLSIPIFERTVTVAQRFADWLSYSSMIFILLFIIYDKKHEKNFELLQIECSLIKRKRKQRTLKN